MAGTMKCFGCKGLGKLFSHAALPKNADILPQVQIAAGPPPVLQGGVSVDPTSIAEVAACIQALAQPGATLQPCPVCNGAGTLPR